MVFSFVLFVGALADSDYSFETYVKQYNRAYVLGSAEHQMRKTLFETRVAEINAHNSQPNVSYFLAINQFTDMTNEERKAFLGYRRRPSTFSTPYKKISTDAPPASVDWRTKGVVTPVKDQGGCGSCWAFATVETVESHVAIASGKLLTLSPQNVVSCTPNPDHCGGTGGCSGATAELGFQYIAQKGVSDEATIPYRGVTGTCSEKAKAAKVTGFVKLPENEQDPLIDAIVNTGPIAISVAADAWFAYGSGVFSGCSKDAVVDHAVQLVGYGVQGTSEYWIVRNSWGSSWGEKGYIRVKKFPTAAEYCGTDRSPEDGSGCDGGPSTVKICGMCGILYDNAYPTGANVTSL